MTKARHIEVRARLEAVLDLNGEKLLSSPLDRAVVRVIEEALTALGGRLGRASEPAHSDARKAQIAR